MERMHCYAEWRVSEGPWEQKPPTVGAEAADLAFLTYMEMLNSQPTRNRVGLDQCGPGGPGLHGSTFTMRHPIIRVIGPSFEPLRVLLIGIRELG
jgi:hypothetical protein